MDGAQQETMLSVAAKAKAQAKEISAALKAAILEIEDNNSIDKIRDAWLDKVFESVADFLHACDIFSISIEAETHEFIEKLQFIVSETSDYQKLEYFVGQLANRYADHLEPAFTNFANAQLTFEKSLEDTAREYQNSALKHLLAGSAVTLVYGGIVAMLFSTVTSDEYWASQTGGQSGRRTSITEVGGLGALSLVVLWLTVQMGLRYFQTREVDVAEIIREVKDPNGYGLQEDY